MNLNSDLSEVEGDYALHGPFFHIKGPGLDDALTEKRCAYFARVIGASIRLRTGRFAASLYQHPYSDSEQVERFLFDTLTDICARVPSNELMCLIEPNHIDDVFLDLYNSNYARGYYDVDRFSFRVNLFSETMDSHEFFNRPGIVAPWEYEHVNRFHELTEPTPDKKDERRAIASLCDCFIGSIVLAPAAHGIVGRTLIDPVWLCDHAAAVRLTSFRTSVRGKRLEVSAFPFRKQDGDALSCAEVSLLDLMCYFSGEYPNHRIIMPHEITEIVERSASQRVRPAGGLDYPTMSRVLRECGFHPQLYRATTLDFPESQTSRAGDGDARALPGMSTFRRMLRTYIDSGLPVAVNLQPQNGKGVGHSLLVIGVEEQLEGEDRPNIGPSDDLLIQRLRGQCSAGEQAGAYKEVSLILGADLEQHLKYVVIDDSQKPYALKPFDELSRFRAEMVPFEMLVPLTSQMVLDALDAYELGVSALTSPTFGLMSSRWGLCERLKDGEELAMTMRMVSARSYIRERASTCDEPYVKFYVSSIFPRYSWLFEIYRRDEWLKESGKRCAIAELLLDATMPILNESSEGVSQVAFMRCGNRILYHAPNGAVDFCTVDENGESADEKEKSADENGESVDEKEKSADENGESVDEKDRIVSFPAFDRNLRHIRPHLAQDAAKTSDS